MIICVICNSSFSGIRERFKLYKHILSHGISYKEYYDKYFKKENEGICLNPECTNTTTFFEDLPGYGKYCCKSCHISLRNKKDWDKLSYRENMSNKLSISQKKRLEDPEYKKLLIERLGNPWEDENNRDRLLLIAKEKMNKLWSDPDFIEKMSIVSKRTMDNNWRNLEWRKKISDRIRDHWLDPEYREKMAPVFNLLGENLSLLNTNNWKSEEYRDKMYKVFEKLFKDRISLGELELYEYVKSISPNAISNQRLNISDITIVPDITVGNKIIEYNGNYWHSFPEVIESDSIRYKLLSDNGYDLLIVWESEWYMNQDETKQRVIEFLEGYL